MSNLENRVVIGPPLRKKRDFELLRDGMGRRQMTSELFLNVG